MTGAGRRRAAEFIRLSREALEEQDGHRLIALIIERNKLLEEAQAGTQPFDLSLQEMKECLEREGEILSRLEQERHKLLEHMESFSKSRNAARKYRATFPFPPLPVFFGSST